MIKPLPNISGSPRPPLRKILAAHLVFHGYGHWLPNDPRGSGSESIRKDKLKHLGDIHFGRKRVQPSREELRRFYREAEEELQYKPFWFNTQRIRETIAHAIGRVAKERGYTVWACAVCSNHGHAVARTHRDSAEVIWAALTEAARGALREMGIVEAHHPVWSYRPYKVFVYTPDEVREKIKYVEDNPGKERLAKQVWDFVVPYLGQR